MQPHYKGFRAHCGRRRGCITMDRDKKVGFLFVGNGSTLVQLDKIVRLARKNGVKFGVVLFE